MKLEVGMYARIDGKIGKVVQICRCEQCKARGYYEPTIEYAHGEKDYVSIYWRDNLKASHNMIDLIEVGDYVNGMQVIAKDSDNRLYVPEDLGEPYYREFSNGCFDYTLLDMEHFKIKSIVTKEQFSEIEYRLGDK